MAVQLGTGRYQESYHELSQGHDQSNTLTPKEINTLLSSI